jgi:DNA-directed RNA polymerase specialized sigma24 family protein
MIQTAESRYNQWVREHYRFLLRSAWGLTGSRAIAEDVVQDCFTSAWQHRSQLRQPELARAWLFRIMRRHVLRHVVPGPQRLDEDYGEFDAA